MVKAKYAFIIMLCISTTFVISIFTHEFGHALGAKLVGIESLKFYVWPGYEISPEFGVEYYKKWPDGAIAFGEYFPQKRYDIILNFRELASRPSLDFVPITQANHQITKFQHGIIGLAGSTFNLLISSLSILILYVFAPKGIALFLTFCGALLVYDIFTYTLLPIYFDARHFVYWGGSLAEPIVALANLGVPQYIAIAMVFSVSIFNLSVLLYFAVLNLKKKI